MNTNRNRMGRPPVYGKAVRRHIATLIRRHGLTGARRRLNASNSDDVACDRNHRIVPEPLGISMPTLAKIKAEYGIVIKQGRPKKR